MTALAEAPHISAIHADFPGIVSAIYRQIGLAVVALGGGRRRAEDRIDHSVGLTEIAAGEPVNDEHPLAIVHAKNVTDAARAAETLKKAFIIGEDAPASTSPIIEILR